ncbi:hypothetical protein [Phyllobacterium leguminum]|uniref:Flagellar export protein FliJ n=1 Tax=Phyllobacterium leguminum TaxID=314237 RepID=A0A318T1N6_9HYPH|nr:hypothetical protein [Phyllobacterium leguminum]PYE87676.1 hypothetical protein C7477_11123 [Phyllobacterium leguminum]
MDRKSLGKMIAVQSLMKARLEMAISGLANALAGIEAENGELLAMLDRRYEGQAAFVDPAAILTRINANMRRKELLEQELANQRQALLQTSRRTELLEGRMVDLGQAMERKMQAEVIEEFGASRPSSSSGLSRGSADLCVNPPGRRSSGQARG